MTTTKTTSNEKIHEALTLLNEAAKDKKNDFSELMNDKYDHLKTAVSGVESELEDKARSGAQKIKEVGHDASENIKQVASTVDKKAHEEPWKIFSWVIAGAFVVGLLFGRKD